MQLLEIQIMSKRFIDTFIWTQNRWFRKLKPKDKLLWIYLICHCDSVGVWEEDFELASFIIGEEFIKEEVTKAFEGKIKWCTNKKLWIIDFCTFQYGLLVEENINNKPHQSYINLLKKHSLWKDYLYSMNRDKEKDKEKEEVFKGKPTRRERNKKYLSLAEYLSKIIQTNKNIKHTPSQIISWSDFIRQLEENDEINYSRIEKALQWYEKHIGEDYVVEIESGKSLKEKFIKLESAVKRVNFQNKRINDNHPPIYDDGVKYVYDKNIDHYKHSVSGEIYTP